MDVRCSRCSTEYEFDDDKVSGAGVTVKCSTCGHVFKVSHTEEQMPAPNLPGNPLKGDWLVKKSDGTVVRFKELTSLQKWIVEQKVERSDQISKTGQTWKRLGEIAELASFFQVVDAANVAIVQPTLPSVLERPQTLSAQPASEVVPEYFLDTAVNLSGGPELSILDDDDPVLQWQKKSKRRKTAFIMFALLAASLGGTAYLRPDLAEQIRKPIAKHLTSLLEKEKKERLDASARQKYSEQVWVALHSGRYGPLEKSLRTLEALPHREQSFMQALISILHVELAKIEFERARLYQLTTSKTRALQSAQDSGKRHLSQADEKISRARRLSPADPWVAIASAAMHAAKNQVTKMQADLDNLSTVANPLPKIVLNEAARLPLLQRATKALNTSNISEIKTALALLKKEEHLGDARFAYAEAALKAKRLTESTSMPLDNKSAIAQADELLAQLASFHLSESDDIRGALQTNHLQSFLEQHAQKKEFIPDAGIPKPNKIAQEETTSNTAKTAIEKDDSTPTENLKNTALNYRKILKKADRARIADRTRSALKYYKQAHELREHKAKPLIGMGWAYIDLGQASKAVGAFKRARLEAPSIVVSQFGLAEAYGALGEKSAAIRAYKKYLKIAPGGADSADARAALKRLQK